MDELINMLVNNAGLERRDAQKVADFLKEHRDEISRWLNDSNSGATSG